MAALPDSLVLAIGRFASASTRGLCQELAEDLDRLSALDPAVIARVASRSRTPEARSAIVDLLERWHREAGSESPGLLTVALRVAASAAEQSRISGRCELVWSGPTPEGFSFRRTDEALLELVRLARQRLTLVTFAAYRVPEIRDALALAVSRRVEVRFVSESEDASGGRLTHDAALALGPELAARVRCYEWPAERRPSNDRGRTGVLHAKCAVADREGLVVASANLTELALDLNMEMGVLILGGALPGQAADHFDGLIREGVLQVVS